MAITQVVDGWPPSLAPFGEVQEVVAAKLDAGSAASSYGYEVLLGLRVQRSGRSTMTGVRVTYLEGVRKKTVDFKSTLAVCTDVKTAEDCPLEYAGE